ncbi:hypothetical protein EG329_010860 [Mollisiaceae sp. DMI_Dod_QoI]|nr:hypothetical protein EG329_010860 [Helotiales sp. DMI_Dod_QoI]
MDYKPLDTDRNEIRLLTLLPDGKNNIVRCSLKHASLLNPPEFCALSYCWGDPKITTEVVINGVPVPVTTNLESALRHLRAKGLGSFWIDAICINQEDKAEKNQQLLWMGSIYRRAKEVHAWIGEGADDFNQSFPSNVANDDQMISDKDSDAALVEFLSRPYWRRVWIVQELAFSGNTIVHCGEREIEWTNLAMRVSELEENPLSSNPAIKNMENLIEFHFDAREVKPVSFLRALWRTRSALSTDPRDKVFALLNLAYDSSLYVPIPNYKQSIRDLCLSITLSALATTGRFDALALLSLGQNCGLEFPSWAIDWFSIGNDKTRAMHYLCQLPPMQPDISLDGWTPRDFYPRYQAAGPIRGSILTKSTVLQVQGIMFDEIDGTCPTPEEFQVNNMIPVQRQSAYTSNAYISDGHRWEQVNFNLIRYSVPDPMTLRHDMFPPYADTESSTLAKWYAYLDHAIHFNTNEGVILMEHLQEKRALAWLMWSKSFFVSGKTLLELAQERCGYGRGEELEYRHESNPMLALGDSSKKKLWTDFIDGTVESTLAPVLEDNMRFMTTKKGYVGWSHINAIRGDYICILAGCSVPVILRAREDGGFHIVGDAYVGGIMDGEVLKMEDMKWEQLDIH